jgi:tRNA(fMet)-specific endonuclease VapC
VSFLVDTDICSLHLRGDRRLFNRFLQHLGRIHISAVTAGELFVWANRSAASAARRQGLLKFISDVTVLDVDLAVAETFGAVRTQQFATGQLTPPMDLLIASTALVHNLTLVTHNVQDYVAVPGLTVLDWLAP